MIRLDIKINIDTNAIASKIDNAIVFCKQKMQRIAVKNT